MKLTEAEALRSDRLPDAEDQKLLEEMSENDPRWNDLFKKYIRSDSASKDYVYIKLSDFTDKVNKKPLEGYLVFTGKTGSGRSALFGRRFDTIELKDLAVSGDRVNADVFSRDDAEAIKNALKRNKDVKVQRGGITFEQVLINPDLPQVIMKYFISASCDENPRSPDSPANRYLRDGFRRLYSLSSGLSYPLVGNNLISIFINAFKDPDLKDKFIADEIGVVSIYQIIAKDIMSSKALMNPQKFLATICFNRNLNKLPSDTIDKLFIDYKEARDAVSYGSKKTIPGGLREWAEFKDQFPRHLLLIESDKDDPLSKIVAGENVTPDDFKVNIGFTPKDAPILDLKIREEAEARKILTKVFPETERSLAGLPEVLSLVYMTPEKEIREVKGSYSEHDDDLIFTYEQQSFEQGGLIKFIWGKKSADRSEKWSRGTALPVSGELLNGLPFKNNSLSQLVVRKDVTAKIYVTCTLRDDGSASIKKITMKKIEKESETENNPK